MSGLMGINPSRNFKIYRTEFPAIFRFNGRLYQEQYDIDGADDRWIEIDEESAQRWLNGERKQFETIEHEHGVLTVNHGPVEPFIPEEEERTFKPKFMGDLWSQDHTKLVSWVHLCVDERTHSFPIHFQKCSACGVERPVSRK